jgi:pimeloyl-ACP methyl ester carboxylesterase
MPARWRPRGCPIPRCASGPTDEVIATLVEVPGIGRWTAEIYAMFSLGRADVICPGDLALQESARMLFAARRAPLRTRLPRDGRTLVALAGRCGAAPLGLLPCGQGTGGHQVTDTLASRRRAPLSGETGSGRHPAPRLRRGRGGPPRPRGPAGAAHARHGVHRPRRAGAVQEQSLRLPVVSDPLARRVAPEAAEAQGLAASTADLNAFLDHHLAAENLTPDRCILFGFSQGTMLSLHVAPRRPDPVAGVVGFSGRLIAPERLAAETRARPPGPAGPRRRRPGRPDRLPPRGGRRADTRRVRNLRTCDEGHGARNRARWVVRRAGLHAREAAHPGLTGPGHRAPRSSRRDGPIRPYAIHTRPIRNPHRGNRAFSAG